MSTVTMKIGSAMTMKTSASSRLVSGGRGSTAESLGQRRPRRSAGSPDVRAADWRWQES